jgi:hypothetical protein
MTAGHSSPCSGQHSGRRSGTSRNVMSNRWPGLAGLVIAAIAAACAPPPAATPATAPDAGAAPTVLSRRMLDEHFHRWCEERKALPETPGLCRCVTDQLHVQDFSDDAARRLVELVDNTGTGSDPAFSGLPADDQDRLNRATDLCGVHLP